MTTNDSVTINASTTGDQCALVNNEIFLRRRRKVFLAAGSGQLPDTTAAALLKNIEPLGFTLSPQVIERLQTLSLEELTNFYSELVAGLRALVGAHREWKPMYPDFPTQVMEMSEARLYLNAILHYWTNRLPQYVKSERLPLLDDVELKPVELGTPEEFQSILSTLVSAKGSLSPQDKEDARWFAVHYGDDVFRLMPGEIPSRETVAFLGSAVLAHTTRAEKFLQAHVKTATDVLRLAVALSDGDVSLAESTKFKNFPRATRRLLLGLLNSFPNATEDMLRWKGRWIRLGERLHPGEWKEKFPNAYNAFDVLRNNKPFETFNAQVEAALEKRETQSVIALLQNRPGELARRLDHLLRLDLEGWQNTLEKFKSVAGQVSTPVLLQVWTHFRHRQDASDLRIFFPKGNVGKVQALPNTLPPLPPEVCDAIAAVLETSLIERFSILEPLGKCFLDEGLSNFTAPFAQRSASKSLRTLSRGSRLALPEANVTRLFLWWKNGRDRTDIDLSAVIYNADYLYLDVLSYYNLKGYGGHHSGDIVDAPQGAAEFIDLDIARLLEKGARYIVMSVNSYTSQPFCDLPECFAGWMARGHADSGEIFEPKTVQDRIDLAADTQVCLPLIIDLEERQVLWTDIALKRSPWWNNVENNLSGVSLMLRAMTGLSKTSLYDLFALHIQARGERVAQRDDADLVFAVDAGITPFDLDRIASEFM